MDGWLSGHFVKTMPINKVEEIKLISFPLDKTLAFIEIVSMIKVLFIWSFTFVHRTNHELFENEKW